MTMLGATPAQLEELAVELGATTAEIGDVHSQTNGVAERVCDEIVASFNQAVTGISTAMGELRTTVDRVQGRLADADWTGTNRATFDGAYGQFNTAMLTLETSVRDAYDQFDGQLKQIAGFIGEFQAEVGTCMTEAQQSTQSMQDAVTAQATNLVDVMNSGLTVG